MAGVIPSTLFTALFADQLTRLSRAPHPQVIACGICGALLLIVLVFMRKRLR